MIAVAVRMSADGRTIVKTVGPSGSNLLGEAAGLRWLAEAAAQGGARVVRVISAEPRRLVIEAVREGRPSAAAARRFGAALARTHAAGADWWGCPPPGWQGPMFAGRSRTPLVEEGEAPSTWGEFFATYRIENYLSVLTDRGDYGASQLRVFARVVSRMRAGEFDSPQPRLVAESGARCARLHGDLWAGNVLWDSDPNAPTGCVLIDPMAYGGHAETDLAMLALFGYPFLNSVYEGYDEVSPLADGWRDRIGLHQLAPLLLHSVLFGDAYLGESVSVAKSYA